MNILILEDNADRCDAMRMCLADRFWQYPARFFADAPAMIAALAEAQEETLLISLDHDLELIDVGGRWIDPGSGRDVANFLAEQRPNCPIVIHTSNSPAAAGMEMVLHESGWQTVRVVPYSDTRWIEESWLPAVRQAIVENVASRVSVKSKT